MSTATVTPVDVAGKYRRLTRDDLKGFDKRSTEFALELGEHGWIGRVSSKGHAIMRAPDGISTTSVTRKHDGRNGINARKEFDRWLRRQQPQQETTSQEDQEKDMTTAELKFDPSGADEDLQLPSDFHCTKCGKEFMNQNALSGHMKAHISRPTSQQQQQTWSFTCPHCFKNFAKKRSLGQHKRSYHPNWRELEGKPKQSLEIVYPQAVDSEPEKVDMPTVETSTVSDLTAFAEISRRAADEVTELLKENERLRERITELEAAYALLDEVFKKVK